MQIINQIGHLQHWGISPAQNILAKFDHQQQKPIKILLTGCSDIRHIMKTVSDVCQSNKFSEIHFYIHETQKQLLCRCLLQLHILHQTHLNFDQRSELFLDLYGNALIKQRDAQYLHKLREDLLNFIHDEKKVYTPIKNFVKLKLLKFQERDQMSQIVQSWSNKIPFDMVKLRDTRLRSLFGSRYDYRANLVDWDFSMLLTQFAPIVHFYHYKQWRLTGLAFQQRFSTYTQPNRTLSSYAPGRKKQSKTSCLVRGYWGDLMCSPYIAMGISCDYPQKDLLFKKANYKYIGHSVQLTQYHMQYWLHKLQKLQTYTKIFKDYYRTDEKGRQQLEKNDQQKKNKKQKKKKQQQIKQLQISQVNEQDQQQIKEQQTKNEQETQGKQQQEEKISQKTQQKRQQAKQTKKQQLDSDQQQQKIKKQQADKKPIQALQSQVKTLAGFEKVGMEVHLMGMPIQSLTKPKFHDFFDIVVMGFSHSIYITKNIADLIKKGGQLYCQKPTYLVPKKKQQRAELSKNLQKLISQRKLETIEDGVDYIIARK